MDETLFNNDSGNSSISSKSSNIQDHWKKTFQAIPTETAINNSEFKKLKLIGKGGFARIELFEWKNEIFEKPLHVALKTNLNEQQDATFEREYKFLQKLNHKNIVKLRNYLDST